MFGNGVKIGLLNIKKDDKLIQMVLTVDGGMLFGADAGVIVLEIAVCPVGGTPKISIMAWL